jgi:HD superfamily phosphohydrolase
VATPTGPTESNSQMDLLAAARRGGIPPATTGAGVPPFWETDGAFNDEFEFLDDVHGAIFLSRLERDAVDTPEFQRLFRLGQLGFVDLVYPTANHTRAVHSIGVCHWSKNLVDQLVKNGKGRADVLQISQAERVLIGLAGLLHDIPHGPFSHDIEKKTHHIRIGDKTKKIKSHYGPYEKHDNWLANPALFVFLNDQQRSVLARVLTKYSPAFASLLLTDAETHTHLNSFARLLKTGLWPDFEQQLLPQLLFHLLVFEKPEEATESSLNLRVSFEASNTKDWGLGPNPKQWKALHEAWYQPYRHDVVGDTLSADLIDYLMRDQARLGMKNQLDLKLLNHYVLVRTSGSAAAGGPHRFRTALNLNDSKRGTFRSERLNDIFRLLDVRHQIHEKAVYHRVVQSAIAMLARSILMMPKKPEVAELYGFDGNTLALGGDDRFLEKLVSLSQTNGRLSAEAHQSLACKLAERRVYRPLMVIPGDRVPMLLKDLCNFSNGLEQPLRKLAAIADSPYFSPFFLLIASAIEKLLAHAVESEAALYKLLSDLAKLPGRLDEIKATIPKRVIFWTTPYKQLYKDPAILVCVGEKTATLEELRTANDVSESLRSRIDAGIKDAETKNEALWKFYVFLSDGLFYTGALATILPSHPCGADARNHKIHLDAAERIVLRALRFAWRYCQDKDGSIDLSSVASTTDMMTMLPMFVAESSWGIPVGISAVKTDQYLHGDDSPICRDVRYKFDSAKDLSQLLDQVPPENRDIVRQAVRGIGLDPSSIRSEEMAEIVSVLAAAPALLPDLVATAARNSPVDPQLLRDLWLDKLKP